MLNTKVLDKLMWHLSHEDFSCEKDAEKSVKKIEKKFPYHEITIKINPIAKYEKTGRPKKEAIADKIFYQVQYQIERNLKAVEVFLNRKGRFIPIAIHF